MDFVKEIYKKVCKFFVLRNFVFRIDVYNGQEESNSIYSDQVMEYEFINQGTTICVIGDGLYLYPESSGMCSCHKRMNINSNEKDVTVYSYKFLPLDFMVVNKSTTSGGGVTTSIPTLVEAVPSEIRFNRLLVISKIVARKRS